MPYFWAVTSLETIELTAFIDNSVCRNVTTADIAWWHVYYAIHALHVLTDDVP